MKKVGESYKTAVLEERYDTVVIGSGMGGLSCAALLAKAGKKVLVLERHYTAGGFTHTFTRPGYEWDVGVHYIGEVNSKDGPLRRIFDYVTEEQLQWAAMDDVYDRAIFTDASYDFVAGKDAFRARMSEYFPSERNAIDRYLEMVAEVGRSTQSFFASRVLPGSLSKLAAPFLCRKFYSYSDRTVREVFCSLTENEKLKGVLATQWGDYGLTPSQASFAIHALVAGHYLKGACYPVGGAGQIAASITPGIERQGGKILVRAEVQEIIIRSGRVAGVRLKDGNEIASEVVVSNTGVLNTLRMLSEDLRKLRPIRQQINEVSPSASHLCLYVGLAHSAEELGLKTTNLWIFPGYDHDANLQNYLTDPGADFPLVYISFPSAKDSDWQNRHPGKATIEIISLAPYDWFSEWKETRWYKRGLAYEEYKEQFALRLLEVLYKHVPQVRGKIDRYELSTPLSTRHFCNYSQGEIYGLDQSPHRFRLSWLRPQWPIPGLYLTGQDIVTVGVAGALISGVLAASAILKRNLMKTIPQNPRTAHSP